MNYALCIMHCKAFFEPPPNHLRTTSEQAKTQICKKSMHYATHYALCIMHSSLNYAFFFLLMYIIV